MTKIMPYTCQHEFQDEKYGKGMRVMNEMGDDKRVSGYRCTICGKEYR